MGLLDNVNFGDAEPQGGLDLSLDEIISQAEPVTGENVEPEVSTVDVDEDKGKPAAGSDTDKTLEVSLEDMLGLDGDTEETGDIEASSSATKETNSSSFLLLRNALAEEGLLPEMDEEGFNKLVEETGSEGAALLKNFNDRFKEVESNIKDTYESDFKTYMELKNAGISQEEAFELSSIQANLNELNDDVIEENESLRRELLTMNYQNTTKWSADRIAKEVEKVVNSGEDIEEAKAALPELKKMAEDSIKERLEAQQKANEDFAKKQAEAVKSIKDTFSQDNVELIKDVKLTKAQALKAQELLLSTVQLENGEQVQALYAERAKNPIEFDKKLASLIAAGAFESKLVPQATAKKSALADLNNKLKSAPKASFKANPGATNEVADEETSAVNDKFLNFIKGNQNQNFI